MSEKIKAPGWLIHTANRVIGSYLPDQGPNVSDFPSTQTLLESLTTGQFWQMIDEVAEAVYAETLERSKFEAEED